MNMERAGDYDVAMSFSHKAPEVASKILERIIYLQHMRSMVSVALETQCPDMRNSPFLYISSVIQNAEIIGRELSIQR